MRLRHKRELYRDMIAATLTSHGFTFDDITEGRLAWRVADRAGVLSDAYAMSRDITDGHIQTILEALFTCAVFRDKKVY